MKTNKKILSILLILIIFLQGSILAVYSNENQLTFQSYEGIGHASELLNTINFQDIRGHWSEPAIQQASALGLVRGIGNRRFGPDQPLTYAQALTILVNGLGLEEEAQRLGESQAMTRVRDLIILSAADDWAKGHIQVATQNNIITQDEINKILNLSASRAEALENQVQNQMDRYLNMDLNNTELRSLENQVRELAQLGATWNRPATREQLAIWVARALELEPIYGQNIVKVYGLSDWREIETANIPYIEAILQKNIMTGVGNNRFSPRGQFTRGQMAQVISNIKDELFEKRGITVKRGEVVNSEQFQQSGRTRGLVTIFNTDGSQNHISVEPPSKDIAVQRNNRLGLWSTLQKGDYITYYINEKNEIIFVQVGAEQEKKVEGFIDFVDNVNNQLIVTDFSNRKHILEVQANTVFFINDKPVSLKDLLFGQEIQAIVVGNRVKRVNGYLDEDPSKHGYISPGSKTKVGDVLFISKDDIEIKTRDGREKYIITSFTGILRGNGKAQLFEIKTGDRVILSFDDIYSPEIATIRVEDNERHIETVYRAVIDGVNPRRNEVILKDVSYYRNSSWNRHSNQKLTLRAEDNTIFDGNRKITLRDLERAIGTEVYVAVENSFGIPRVAKMLLKQGSTVNHESKISSIQFGTNQMVVDNNRVFFHQGTIVVKNNRLVDVLNLDLNQTVYVVSDLLRGVRNSAFIAIEGEGLLDPRTDETQIKIYRGKIEDIYDYSVTIGRLSYSFNYLQLLNNQWSQVPTRQRVTVTDDTYIFDSQLKLEIPTSAFLDSRFIDPNRVRDSELRERLEQGYYRDKTAYFVVKESNYGGETYSEVLAINITPSISSSSNVRFDHSAIGNVETINFDQEQITLRDVKHWNNLNSRWEPVRATEVVDLTRATIIVNDKPVDRDSFYRIKKGAQTYLVKVKNTSSGDEAYVLIIEQ